MYIRNWLLYQWAFICACPFLINNILLRNLFLIHIPCWSSSLSFRCSLLRKDCVKMEKLNEYSSSKSLPKSLFLNNLENNISITTYEWRELDLLVSIFIMINAITMLRTRDSYKVRTIYLCIYIPNGKIYKLSTSLPFNYVSINNLLN